MPLFVFVFPIILIFDRTIKKKDTLQEEIAHTLQAGKNCYVAAAMAEDVGMAINNGLK